MFVPEVFPYGRTSDDITAENTGPVTRVRHLVLTLAVLSQGIVVGKPFSTIGAPKCFDLSVLFPQVVAHTLSAEKSLTTQITLVPALLMALHVLRQADFLNKGQLTSWVGALVFSLSDMSFQVAGEASHLQPTEEALNFSTLVATGGAGGVLAQVLHGWELQGAGGAGEALDFTTVHQPGNGRSSVLQIYQLVVNISLLISQITVT